jgi:hypothetical protein
LCADIDYDAGGQCAAVCVTLISELNMKNDLPKDKLEDKCGGGLVMHISAIY